VGKFLTKINDIINIAIESNRIYQNINTPVFEVYYESQKKGHRISVVKRIMVYIYKILLCFKNKGEFFPHLDNSKNMYFYDTLNQKKALTPLFLKDVNSMAVSVCLDDDADIFLNELIPLLIGLFSLPIFLYYFLFKKHTDITHRFLIDKYMISIGYYFYFKIIFNKSNNQPLIVANDHNTRIRAIILAAKKINLSVVYIQHASVSKFFPSLNLFDMAFLDGQSSFDVYNHIEKINIKVVISGAIRNFNLTINKKNRCNKAPSLVVIAINPMTNLSTLMRLIEGIFKWESSVKINLRLHPAQKKSKFIIENKVRGKNVLVTGAWSESLNDCFDKADVLFSGSSSIHLEALRKGVLPVLVEIEDNNFDYYGYLNKKAVLSVDEFWLLPFDDYKNKINVLRQRSLYFDAALKATPDKCNEILIGILKKITEN